MTEQEHTRAVRIHIDEHRYESPNPTTGMALYQLGRVADGLDLYREVEGNHEDKVVENDPKTIHLIEDEHLHSGSPQVREVTIIVNGTAYRWAKRKITYAEVVTLDVPDYAQHPEISYSVKYKKGPSHRSEGTLSPGGSVKVREGMVFSVSPTSQS